MSSTTYDARQYYATMQNPQQGGPGPMAGPMSQNFGGSFNGPVSQGFGATPQYSQGMAAPPPFMQTGGNAGPGAAARMHDPMTYIDPMMANYNFQLPLGLFYPMVPQQNSGE